MAKPIELSLPKLDKLENTQHAKNDREHIAVVGHLRRGGGETDKKTETVTDIK